MRRPTPPDSVAGVPCLPLHSPDGARALVSRWGAQVLSWCPAGGNERLFLSERAVLDGSAPVRGGVPLVFPQFANHGPLAAHGFARDRLWEIQEQRHDGMTLTLRADDERLALWPHAFSCEFQVRVDGPSLYMELRVSNRGAHDFTFQVALHTYLRVDELAALRIDGLAGASYLDRAHADRQDKQHEPELAIVGEIDRIYTEAPRHVVVREPQRTTEITNSGGFNDLVVWNPGAERCARIVDLAPQAWRQLLCIEAAQVANPQQLPPGQVWYGAQRLTAL